MPSARSGRLMRRNRFDHIAKEVGEEALRASGTTLVNEEINSATQYADLSHAPDPARRAERDRLGLLGRLAAEPCLIEVYSEAPGPADFRACLAKHLAAWQARARDHRRWTDSQQPPETFVDSFLWIIAAGAPRSILTKLKFEAAPAPDWPKGVYCFGADVLRVGIVVASELPSGDTTTLLVRIMAAGPLLAQAVKEVAALPADAYERVIVEPALLSFQQSLGQVPSQNRDQDEEAFIMAMIKSWEEGKAEARTETRAHDVLTVFRVRGLAVTDPDRERILAQKDLAQLERWLERAIVASSVAEVIDEPS
jgi:hypothetical protein